MFSPKDIQLKASTQKHSFQTSFPRGFITGNIEHHSFTYIPMVVIHGGTITQTLQFY